MSSSRKDTVDEYPCLITIIKCSNNFKMQLNGLVLTHTIARWLILGTSCILIYHFRTAVLPLSSVSNSSGLGLEPDQNCCNRLYHTKTRTVSIGPVLPPTTRHFNTTTLAPINYWSSDRIVTWSVCTLCSSSCSSTSRCQICDPTYIRWVAINNPWISPNICPRFTATQRI